MSDNKFSASERRHDVRPATRLLAMPHWVHVTLRFGGPKRQRGPIQGGSGRRGFSRRLLPFRLYSPESGRTSRRPDPSTGPTRVSAEPECRANPSAGPTRVSAAGRACPRRDGARHQRRLQQHSERRHRRGARREQTDSVPGFPLDDAALAASSARAAGTDDFSTRSDRARRTDRPRASSVPLGRVSRGRPGGRRRPRRGPRDRPRRPLAR